MKKTPDQLAKQRAQAKERRSDPAYREKWNSYQREWAKANPRSKESLERKNAMRRERLANDPSRRLADQARRTARGSRAKEHRLKKYGLPDSEYQRMLSAQRGLCALCKQMPDKETFHKIIHVDHDHGTGEVRGLLCWPCNRDLGGYERFLRTCGIDAVNRYLAGWPQIETEMSEAM